MQLTVSYQKGCVMITYYLVNQQQQQQKKIRGTSNDFNQDKLSIRKKINETFK